MPVERPNTVAGLLDKHRTIAGQIAAARKHLDALVGDLEALEHTIRLFDPDAQLGRARPVWGPQQAFRGEMRRDVLAILRAADGETSTSLDMARQIIAARALPDDAKTVILLRKRVTACLCKLRAKGMLEEVPQAAEYKGWRLAR
jgi:hypothetical protein